METYSLPVEVRRTKIFFLVPWFFVSSGYVTLEMRSHAGELAVTLFTEA